MLKELQELRLKMEQARSEGRMDQLLELTNRYLDLYKLCYPSH